MLAEVQEKRPVILTGHLSLKILRRARTHLKLAGRLSDMSTLLTKKLSMFFSRFSN